MKILITSDSALHLQAIGSTDQQEAATRQELAVSVEFADTSLIDEDTTSVSLKLKTTRSAENLAASATLARVGATAVYSGYLNLSTSILNALADGSSVLMECTWIVDTKTQRSDPRQIIIRQAVVTGDEGGPEADQSVSDRLTWLTDYILAGANITITEDSDLGTITIAGAAGGSAWADITGKPATFTPATHSHTISDTTGLQAAIDGKAATSHTHIIADTTGLQAAIDGKAATSHTHAISDVTNLQSSLDGKSATGHTHVSSEVGLGNVDNTSDANKPVSTAVQSALNLKLNLAGGTMTGALTISAAFAYGATRTAGLTLANTTAATNGTQQTPPAIIFSGNRWDTTSSASEEVQMRIGMLPIQQDTFGSYMTGAISLKDVGAASGWVDAISVRLQNAGHAAACIGGTDWANGYVYLGKGSRNFNADFEGVKLTANGNFAWTSASSGDFTPDLYLHRDAAGILALKNSTNAQKLRVYGTTTGSKYLQLEHDGTNAIISASSGILNLQGATSLSGLSLTGSQATNALDISATWNTTGAPALIYGRATNTASGASATLLDLGTVAGGSLFKVDKTGTIITKSAGSAGGGSTQYAITGSNNSGGGGILIGDHGIGGYIGIQPNNGIMTAFAPAGLVQGSPAYIGFSSNTYPGYQALSADVMLYRDAAGILAQRNSTNAQTKRIYGTYTDASNYTRLSLAATSTTMTIAAETAGAGADDIDLTFTPAGTGNVRFGTHSALAAETVTGYITIKDASGTTRKLAVVS